MRRNSGFSLIELLVSVALVGIIASLAVPLMSEFRDKAHRAAALSGLHNIHLAIEVLYTDTGQAPGAFAVSPCVDIGPGNEFEVSDCRAGLLCDDGSFSNWAGPYLTVAEVIDPWGNEYFYDSDYACTTSIQGCAATEWVRAVNTIGPDGIPNNYDDGEAALVLCTGL